MKILEAYAIDWLRKKINITKHQKVLVIEFAKEVERLMEIGREENEQKN